jgi:FtsP/CotA-like multicopper oxidase with cupredoxin domain
MKRTSGFVTMIVALVLCAFTAGVALAADPEVKTHKQPYPDRWNSIRNPPVSKFAYPPDIWAAENMSFRTTGKLVEYYLTIEQIKWNIVGDVFVTQWAFNGQVPGPLLTATEGDIVRITVKNNTTIDHTIHPHGQWVAVNMDGVPNVTQLSIQPGETFVYEFMAKPSGHHFYHCHVNAATHMDMGLYGSFIVYPGPEVANGTTDKQAADPAAKIDRDYVMILDEVDTRIDDGESGGMELGHPRKIANFNYFTINGKSFPESPMIFVREGDIVRVRFLNFGYWSHAMHLHGHAFAQASAECDRCPRTWEFRDAMNLNAAQRTDIVFKANNPGRWVFHCHRVPHATNDGAYPGGLLTIVEYENNPYLPVIPPLPLPGFKTMDDPKTMNMSLSHKAVKKQVLGE